ncbi:hypothetical protein F2Q69_00020534 [Brassica cretica]|uniref:Uncharacterized protein n=1 Tax=Brassica cretica TaxID=69181 RepID=A0A8S9QV58_BRACR|nr:hypothetical protein F2Q69_00020534 [Brassica cretica]
MAHEQKPKSDEAKSLCDDSIRETEMQKSVCRFHWLGFDHSVRLLSIHRNEIASGSIAVNKIVSISVYLIFVISRLLIQDPTQQTDIDNFMVSGVMEPKTSWLVANCILDVCKAGVIDSLSMAFSLQSEGRRAKEPKPMSDDSFENYNQEEKERLCNNYFYVALSEK